MARMPATLVGSAANGFKELALSWVKKFFHGSNSFHSTRETGTQPASLSIQDNENKKNEKIRWKIDWENK